ncbi:hypothetical protein AVEN_69279-1 [Araneus ventricosus]|uniref:Uncharacterized protein n=1 Tax=Araneus ventricosus TaxID=182803 RepID=A0A4Y2WJI2_ARAVE|nr:hypothetical protein AVEN_69279-1 [Araneus ventricosus]
MAASRYLPLQLPLHTSLLFYLCYFIPQRPAYPKGCKTLKVVWERTKITAPGKSYRHLALTDQNLFIVRRLTNIPRTWAVFNPLISKTIGIERPQNTGTPESRSWDSVTKPPLPHCFKK